MVKIRFVNSAGVEKVVEGEAGRSVMQTALDNDIGEILGDCGGSLSCATCHVHIAREWLDRVGAPQDIEVQMLEMAVDPDETSRLSCQIELTGALDGLVINLPESQL